jgi:ParB family chromosome partitioning protein
MAREKKEKLERVVGGFERAVGTVVAGNPTRMIKISDIKPPKKHDRSQFSEEAIKNLAENIKVQGLLQPIVVRKLEEGEYERIAGYRRLLAVMLLGHTEILARVIEADDLSALKAMLSENTQREDLNVYDKAVFFEEIILAAMNFTQHPAMMDMSTHDLKRRLMRMRNRSNGNISESITDDETLFEEIMNTEILSQYGYGIDSFVKFMSILDFDERIIEALKNNRIERIAGAEINRLATKHPALIQEALDRAFGEGMGMREVNLMVNAYLNDKSDIQTISIKDIEKAVGFKKIPKNKKLEAKTIIEKFVTEIKGMFIPREQINPPRD